MSHDILTTTEAAKLAAVAPTTVKRWADQGHLTYTRTAGGHRRIDRTELERFLKRQASPTGNDDSLIESWIQCLVTADRYRVDGQLLLARSRLGSWYRVADELGEVLKTIGVRWRQGRFSIADEHVASAALSRALDRVGDNIPVAIEGPSCVLASPGQDEHSLGLSLADVCLREAGWCPQWLGSRTPPGEIVNYVERNNLAMVALSASSILADVVFLKRLVQKLEIVCASRGALLVLGGAGAWPDNCSYAVRLESFAEFHQFLSKHATD